MNELSDRRIAALISGRGSNMLAIAEACRDGRLDAEVQLVISNRPEADGISLAKKAGIAVAIIDHRRYGSREAFDQALVDCLHEHAIDVTLLAGFMRIFTPVFTNAYRGRLLNIHPSLLPKYPGLNTHQRAIDAGDEEAGATVHFVTAELDGGPPILQARVQIAAEDTASALAQRILTLEHEIYPVATQWLLQGRLQLTEQGALLDEQPIPPTGIPYAPGIQA